ncbi:MAG: hypothetical protein IJ466_01115 [Clostridia bacterium]|nr:hypothetical protein [Clostridia bacterium]
MALFRDGLNNSQRRVRAEMEDAARKNTSGEFQEKLLRETGDEKFAKTYRTRGKLYDKIKIPLKVMDIIIYALVALIVIALVVGIAIGPNA